MQVPHLWRLYGGAGVPPLRKYGARFGTAAPRAPTAANRWPPRTRNGPCLRARGAVTISGGWQRAQGRRRGIGRARRAGWRWEFRFVGPRSRLGGRKFDWEADKAPMNAHAGLPRAASPGPRSRPNRRHCIGRPLCDRRWARWRSAGGPLGCPRNLFIVHLCSTWQAAGRRSCSAPSHIHACQRRYCARAQ